MTILRRERRKVLFDRSRKNAENARYADVHCHILSGVDDGSPDLATSLRMLRIAEREGITDVILTPHYLPGRSRLTPEILREKTAALQTECAREGIPVRLYPGAELYYTDDALELLAAHMIPTLNGTNRVLTEFTTHAQEADLLNAVKQITGLDLVPVIAHVERYESVAGHPDRVARLKEEGAEIQVNASSIEGTFGPVIRRQMEKLIRERLVDYIGTDAHNDTFRAPEMGKCAKRLMKIAGRAYTEEIMLRNTESLL